jgi:hypothetical protein
MLNAFFQHWSVEAEKNYPFFTSVMSKDCVSRKRESTFDFEFEIFVCFDLLPWGRCCQSGVTAGVGTKLLTSSWLAVRTFREGWRRRRIQRCGREKRCRFWARCLSNQQSRFGSAIVERHATAVSSIHRLCRHLFAQFRFCFLLSFFQLSSSWGLWIVFDMCCRGKMFDAIEEPVFCVAVFFVFLVCYLMFSMNVYS